MNLTSSLNLASETPLEKDDLRKTRSILQFLEDSSDSAEFRQPVDWQSLGLLDYRQIVTNPMDLRTVGEKLQGEQYRFVQEVLDDLQLIWDNCKNYNQRDSWIYAIADKMDKYYKKLIKNYFTHVAITQTAKTPAAVVEHVTPPPLARASRATSKKTEKKESKVYCQEEEVYPNDKYRLMDGLKNLKPDNLGRIVELILENCPKACRFMEQDYCQISLQKIDACILEEIKATLLELRETEDKLSKRLKI